ISGYLSTVGRVFFTGEVSSTAYTLTATVQSATAGLVRSARTAQAALLTSPSGTSGSATVLTAPVLNLPATFAAQASSGSLNIPNLVGNGTTPVRVVLAVDAGPAASTPTLSSVVGNGLVDGVTVSGSESAQVILSGTAAAVSSYLATPDRIRFNAAASGVPYRLTATVQALADSVVQSAVSAHASITTIAAPQAVPALTVPASFSALNVSAGVHSGEIRMQGAVGTGGETLTVALAVSGGTLTGASGTAEGVTVAGSGTQRITLTGSAAAISGYLNTANRVVFSGASSSTPYGLVVTAQNIDSAGNIRSASTSKAVVLTFSTSNDVTATADIVSGGGSITIISSRSVMIDGTADIRTSAGGTIDIEAREGEILQSPTSVILSTGTAASARLVAKTNVTLG
ncbi:MAG: hypothetical protein EB027_07560, partial [Actinobacteria bacterium]|nr:hypothetical protein [Actinomycetota bacterium]